MKLNKQEQLALALEYAKKFWGDSKNLAYWQDYYLKEYYLLKVSVGVIAFRRKKVVTEFWEGEDEGFGGRTIAEAYKILDRYRTPSGFLAANLEEFDRASTHLVSRKRVSRLRAGDIRWNESDIVIDWLKVGDMTDEDYKSIRSFVIKLRKEFAKKVASWYKRYGANKIKCHTYWISA
jgi:hypothetical protein